MTVRALVRQQGWAGVMAIPRQMAAEMHHRADHDAFGKRLQAAPPVLSWPGGQLTKVKTDPSR